MNGGYNMVTWSIEGNVAANKTRLKLERGWSSHNYAWALFLACLVANGVHWITTPHLAEEVFEDLVHMPVAFGRCFVEGKVPAAC